MSSFNVIHPGLQRQIHRVRLEAQLNAERRMNATMDEHGSRVRDSSEVINVLEVMRRQGEVAVSAKVNDVLRAWCGGPSRRSAVLMTARDYASNVEEETSPMIDQGAPSTSVDIPSHRAHHHPSATIVQNPGPACVARPTKKTSAVFVEITQRHPRIRKPAQRIQPASMPAIERSPSVILLETPPPPLCPLLARLSHSKIPPFPIPAPRSLQNVYFTRDFFKRHFGGDPFTQRQMTRGPIPRICHVLFITGAPYTPPSPGSPGLFMHHSPSNDLWPQRTHLMCKIPAKNGFQYFGLYTYVPLRGPPTLEPDEWRGLSNDARARWIGAIAATMDRCSRMIRARAKLGKEATQEEVSEMADTGAVNKWLVPMNLIRDALDEGLARLHVWGLKCVGYDEEFAKLIRAKQREEAVHAVPLTGKRKRGTVTNQASVNKTQDH